MMDEHYKEKFQDCLKNFIQEREYLSNLKSTSMINMKSMNEALLIFLETTFGAKFIGDLSENDHE